MDELLAQFLIEGPELVQQGSDALLALEQSPDDRALVDNAFRAVHTLKGSVGLFDLPAMATTLHASEDVLGAVRSGVRGADRPTIDALLAVLTQTERWLSALEAGGVLPGDAPDVARRLAEQLHSHAAAPIDTISSAVPGWALALRDAAPALVGPLTAVRYSPAAGCYFSGDDPVALIRDLSGLSHMELALRPVAADEDAYDPYDCRLVILAITTATAAEVKAGLRFVPDQVEIVALPSDRPGSAPAVDVDSQSAIRTLRVDAARVEALAAMVDDLVSAKTALAAVASMAVAGAEPASVARSLSVQSELIDRLAGQIHGQVMVLRMTPVAPLLRRFPRVARELAASLGKEIDFVVQDNGVEADKAVIEGLFEPLTHLLRNAIDHGIEAPAVRESRGKPRRGVIHLVAEASGGRFELTLRDDGAGVDPAAIRAAVAAKGLLSAEDLAALGDARTVDLIFLPGFSTASTLTDVSGRGVGMDAVKSAVQRQGGRVAIDSRPGEGTTMTLSLPLSLSLTKVLVVSSEGETWGVPMDRVLETVRMPATAVSAIRSGQAFNWRNRTVPLLSLAGLVGGNPAPWTGDHRALIVRCGSEIVGIAVDAIQDRADVAVRPLDGLLAGMPGVSGATLLGDGRVLMVLDPEALVG